MEEAIEINMKLKQEVGQCEKNAEESVHSDMAVPNGSTKTETGTVTTANCDSFVKGKDDEPRKAVEHKESFIRSRAKSKDGSSNLMQMCIDCFQNFFHTLVSQKLIQDVELVQKYFDSLIVKSDQFFTLEKDTEVTVDSVSEYSAELSEDDSKRSEDMRIPLADVDEKCLETFTGACQLLVEFASFPMYCTDTRQQYTGQKQGMNLNTLQPLYNTVRYNTVLDITQFKDGSQKCIDYIEK